MGTNSKQSSGADATGNLLYFSPEKLTLVTDKAHPLFDERAGIPLDESLVLNVMMYGIIQPIVVRNNGKDAKGNPIIEVVAGRQRVRACLEANARLKKKGMELLRVPAVMKRAEQGALLGVTISENEHRKGDSAGVRARKLARFLDTGKTEAEAAITFGVTAQTVKNLLKVLELAPAVQKAMEKDGVPLIVAKELSALPQEEQAAALEKLVAAGTARGARGVEAARRVRDGKSAEATKVRMMSKHQLGEWKKKLKAESGKDADIAYAVVSRILGGERSLANFPRLRDTLEAAQS